MWMSGVLCRRVVVDILFVAHLVPRERFKWYKIGLLLHLYHLKRFLVHGIVTRDQKMVINGVGKSW